MWLIKWNIWIYISLDFWKVVIYLTNIFIKADIKSSALFKKIFKLVYQTLQCMGYSSTSVPHLVTHNLSHKGWWNFENTNNKYAKTNISMISWFYDTSTFIQLLWFALSVRMWGSKTDDSIFSQNLQRLSKEILWLSHLCFCANFFYTPRSTTSKTSWGGRSRTGKWDIVASTGTRACSIKLFEEVILCGRQFSNKGPMPYSKCVWHFVIFVEMWSRGGEFELLT